MIGILEAVVLNIVVDFLIIVGRRIMPSLEQAVKLNGVRKCDDISDVAVNYMHGLEGRLGL